MEEDVHSDAALAKFHHLNVQSGQHDWGDQAILTVLEGDGGTTFIQFWQLGFVGAEDMTWLPIYTKEIISRTTGEIVALGLRMGAWNTKYDDSGLIRLEARHQFLLPKNGARLVTTAQRDEAGNMVTEGWTQPANDLGSYSEQIATLLAELQRQLDHHHTA